MYAEVTTLIAITIFVLINMAITDVLMIARFALQTAPTTIVTVALTKSVTTTVTSAHFPPTSLTVVAAVPLATTATHDLVVAHAAMIGPNKPPPADIVMDLMREMREDPA